MSIGATSSTTWQTIGIPGASSFTWSQLVPLGPFFGCAGSRSDQADHRPQGRTYLAWSEKPLCLTRGAPAGSDEVFDAAFRRAGILRVNTVDELFGMAEVLGKQPRPHGSRLAIVTNGGGPGALAADALIEGNGSLANLSDQTIETLNNLLPPFWSRSNPVDLVGDAKANQYAAAVDALIKDPNNDALLIILTPQATAEPTATAERLKSLISTRQNQFSLVGWVEMQWQKLRRS